MTQEFARKFILRKEVSDIDEDRQFKLRSVLFRKKTRKPKYNSKDYSTFENHPGFQLLKKRKSEAIERNIAIPFFLTNERANNNNVIIDGKEYINFSGYNYLGLSGHPYISSAAKQAIDQFGTSVSASRIVSGQITLHLKLEKVISDFLGVEDCVAFVSGYNTNVTTIGHLFGRKDLVIHDSMAHNSIMSGCHLSNATRMSFPRNDWCRLATLLAEHRQEFQRVVIIIEGAYSTDGNIPEINKVIEIKKQYDCFLMVDEAHSLGVIGKQGRGIGEHFSVNRQDVDIWMGSLSKSFASCGGFIAGSKDLVEYLKFSAPGFIFSVGLSPSDTAAAIAAFELIQKEPERIEKLRHNTKLFLSLSAEAGLDTGMNSGTPIVPIVIGDAMLCMQLSKSLYESGIHVQPMIYPAVPYNDARLRFFITAMHSEDEIKYTVNQLVQKLAELGINNR